MFHNRFTVYNVSYQKDRQIRDEAGKFVDDWRITGQKDDLRDLQ